MNEVMRIIGEIQAKFGEIHTLLGAIDPSLAYLHDLPLYIFLIVIGLTAVFLIYYFFKGIQIWYQLARVLHFVKRLKKVEISPKPEEVGKIFKWEPLRHLWIEYQDTLHEVHQGSSGGVSLVEIRATVPAESMFTKEVLVESRLFDEFTRHLPGILTGLGIIGTFAGLLDGLKKFDPSTTAKAIEGLAPLMTGVQHAFIASGAAIFCAMVVVFVSRFSLTLLYRRVERLTQVIDGLYSTGAGEEYLARLVKSSEQSATSTAQLKDALVEDLSKMMTNLVDRQIESQNSSALALGKQIGESISSAIAEPMKRVGEVMERTTKGNGDQVNSILENLLTGFMAKLEDTFGGQMRGINEQMQRSMDSMATVQASLQGLLEGIKHTNEHAATQMSGTLEDAMKKATDNQQVLTDQMREFVQDFRRLVQEEQSKSKQVMDETLNKVLGEVARAVENLEMVRKSSAQDENDRNTQLNNQTSQMVGGLSSQVDALINAVTDQVALTQKNVDSLGLVSLRAIDGMNQGAITIGAAAQRFETAGESVTNVFNKSAQVAEVLSNATNSLQSAASAIRQGFDQYDSTRSHVDSQVSALIGLIESAKKEAGVSQELVANIRSSADALRRSESESREHLEKVNEALIKAFSDFGNSLVSQVKSTIAETDRHLAQGTGHLNGVVQELAQAVQRMKRA